MVSQVNTINVGQKRTYQPTPTEMFWAESGDVLVGILATVVILGIVAFIIWWKYFRNKKDLDVKYDEITYDMQREAGFNDYGRLAPNNIDKIIKYKTHMANWVISGILLFLAGAMVLIRYYWKGLAPIWIFLVFTLSLIMALWRPFKEDFSAIVMTNSKAYVGVRRGLYEERGFLYIVIVEVADIFGSLKRELRRSKIIMIKTKERVKTDEKELVRGREVDKYIERRKSNELLANTRYRILDNGDIKILCDDLIPKGDYLIPSGFREGGEDNSKEYVDEIQNCQWETYAIKNVNQGKNLADKATRLNPYLKVGRLAGSNYVTEEENEVDTNE